MTTVLPTRFREAEERGVRLGRSLRRIARVREVDEELMARIGAGMTRRDQLGHDLATALRRPAGDPDRLTHADLARVLEGGLDAVPHPPAELVALVREAETVPDWVDWDLLRRGQQVYHRLGRNAADVLLQLSLVGGYRFGGPTDLLVATGGLTGETTLRRLAETQRWAVAISSEDALRPYGEGWRLTVHVRAMHALVDSAFEDRWDVARWGLPVNQTDQAATLGLFDAVALLGVRALGVPVSSADSRAVMHLWRYVGWLMGVEEEWLVDRERERHRINYHLLLAQADVTEAGPALAQAVVAAQGERWYPRFAWLHRRWERERLLSMLTVFLGVTSMRELGLPARPPWAVALAIALNTVRYRLLGRGRAGARRLDRWGDRVSSRLLRSYYGPGTEQELGRLPR